MAFTIVRVSSGGIPVVESATGLPYYEADNGYGIPVTFGSTGVPLGGVRVYTGQIATRSFNPINSATTNKQMQTRSRHLCQQSVSSLQIVVPNFWVPTSGGSLGVESALGATSTVTASIEYPAGTFAQVTFSSSTSGTVPDGGILVSDPVSVTIPQAAYFFVRMYITNTAGIVYGGGSIIDFNNGEGFNYGASGISDQTMGGTVINKDSVNCCYPCAIIGRTNRASVAFIGDSRVYGVNDTYSDTSGDRGELARSVGPTNAYISLSTPGDKAQLWVASHTNRLALAQYCSNVIPELGINDISGGRTSAQLISDLATIAGFIGKPTFYITLPPKTTSTDSWATLANQTVTAQEAQRVSFNTSVRAGLSGASGYFEVANQVESAQNSGKWVVTGAANYATSDGIHESNAANLLIKNSGAINPALFRV